MSREIIYIVTNNHELSCLDTKKPERAVFLFQTHAGILDREFYHIKNLSDKKCHSVSFWERNRPTSGQTSLIAFRTLFGL